MGEAARTHYAAADVAPSRWTTLEAVRTLLVANFAEGLQYRGSAIMWTLTGFASQLMALAIWTSVANERGGTVGDYGKGDLVTYFLATQLVAVFTASWASFKMWQGITTGSLSPELLRPIPAWVGWFTEIVGFKLVMILMQVPALMLAAAAFGATMPQVTLLMLAVPVAILLTLALRFTVEICLGSTCFWLTDLRGTAGTFFLLYLLFSGSFAPIALMPPALRSAAEVMPFYYMLGFPVDLITGRLTPAQAATGFAMQAVWLVVALALGALLWRRGLRQFSAVGA